ncbi:alpha/beta fold hydrolase [Comamonas thiooxydans]|uniref:alpha/beta fold hydrolase n=1 Tax=Comamonas thiooxydans TaxID=363952 RepID=UPI000B362E27|nr:alpha/beta hydrolase [Comamonas thiooxydans]
MTTSSTCLVLLPGLLCDAFVWEAQCEAISFVDCFIPSYGDLSSITSMARHVLDTAPAELLYLAGHSMGGRVALEIARQAPNRVQRMALLDTGMDPIVPGEPGAAERAKRMALLEVAKSQGMRKMGRDWARGMVHPSQLDSPLFEQILEMIERQTPETFLSQITALLGRPDARAVLAGLQCPTMFLCGRQDVWSPLSRHEEMHAMVSGSSLVVIEDSGHMTTMEQPLAVSRALINWLRS